jgi:hypothetical protein
MHLLWKAGSVFDPSSDRTERRRPRRRAVLSPEPERKENRTQDSGAMVL